MNTKSLSISPKNLKIKPQSNKNNVIYILSDTKRLNSYSNFIYIKDSLGFFTPVFQSYNSIQLVKQKTKHEYNIIKTDSETLETYIPNDVRIHYYDNT